jgi:hypothetical protein
MGRPFCPFRVTLSNSRRTLRAWLSLKAACGLPFWRAAIPQESPVCYRWCGDVPWW